MTTTTKAKRIGDMTVDELQSIIRDTMHEFIDPDYGLLLRPDIEKELKESRKQRKKGEGSTLDAAKKQLGLP
ncbi:MAG: hypothetical protein C0392_04000 [Syntrophus sp. (in: bacteria)]|nr:hypothetical protein [Syntrophus sp. (in: bacteria)]